MKILLVIPTFERGGAERVVSLLSREWAKRHEVVVCTFDSSANAYAMGGDIVDLRLSATAGLVGKLTRFVQRCRGLVRVMRNFRPDACYAFMESANLTAVIASMLAANRHRLTISVRIAPAMFHPAHALLVRVAYRIPRRIVCVSAGVADALARRFALRTSRLCTIPNPIDLDAVDASRAQGSPHPRPFILGVGRLDLQKGFDVLIDAYARIAADVAYDLVIVGGGSEHQRLGEQAERLGLAGRVFLTGTQSDPWRYMHHCRLFVLSSRHEGWPNALIEAMACGRAVIACDCDSGPREIIMPGENGLLVPIEDPAALSAAMRTVIADEPLASRLGEAARSWARRYAIEPIAQGWLR